MLGDILDGNEEFNFSFSSAGQSRCGVNLATIFDAQFPGARTSGPVKAVITVNGVIGACSNGYANAAIFTGTGWVAGSDLTLVIPPVNGSLETATTGIVLGAGGGANGNRACPAIRLNYPLKLINHGFIAGGGGTGADRGGPHGNGGGGAGIPPGGSTEGSGPGGRRCGGGGSGGSGWGGGLGMIGGCASYCPGEVVPAVVTNGHAFTILPESTRPYLLGNMGLRENCCDPNNLSHRNGGIRTS